MNTMERMLHEAAVKFNQLQKQETAFVSQRDYGLFKKWSFQVLNTTKKELTVFTVKIKEQFPDVLFVDDTNDEYRVTQETDLPALFDKLIARRISWQKTQFSSDK